MWLSDRVHYSRFALFVTVIFGYCYTVLLCLIFGISVFQRESFGFAWFDVVLSVFADSFVFFPRGVGRRHLGLGPR